MTIQILSHILTAQGDSIVKQISDETWSETRCKQYKRQREISSLPVRRSYVNKYI